MTNADKSVRNFKSIYIEHFEATIAEGKIKNYRVNAKITFVLD